MHMTRPQSKLQSLKLIFTYFYDKQGLSFKSILNETVFKSEVTSNKTK